jgi:hypothetical protein
VGPRTGLDDMERRIFLTLPGLELRPFDRPAFSQSLYRLRYPGSQEAVVAYLKVYFLMHQQELTKITTNLRITDLQTQRGTLGFQNKDKEYKPHQSHLLMGRFFI